MENKNDTPTTAIGATSGVLIGVATFASTSPDSLIFWLGLTIAILQGVFGYLANKK